MTRSRSRDTAKAKDYAKAKDHDNGHYDHGHRDNYTMPRSRSRGKHKDPAIVVVLATFVCA